MLTWIVKLHVLQTNNYIPIDRTSCKIYLSKVQIFSLLTQTVQLNTHSRKLKQLKQWIFTWPSDKPIGELSTKSGGAKASINETASSLSSLHSSTMLERISRVGKGPLMKPPVQIIVCIRYNVNNKNNYYFKTTQRNIT